MSRPLLVIAAAFLLTVGALGAIQSGGEIADRVRWKSTAAELVQARVVEEVDAEGVRYSPSVVYRFTLEGKIYDNSHVEPGRTPSFRDRQEAQKIVDAYAGSGRVNVRYDPADPARSALRLPLSVPSLVLAIGGLGGAAFLLAPSSARKRRTK